MQNQKLLQNFHLIASNKIPPLPDTRFIINHNSHDKKIFPNEAEKIPLLNSILIFSDN